MNIAGLYLSLSLMVGVMDACIAAESLSPQVANLKQENLSAQYATTDCSMPLIERGAAEAVSSFKRRLRERQEVIESCRRNTLENIPARQP